MIRVNTQYAILTNDDDGNSPTLILPHSSNIQDISKVGLKCQHDSAVSPPVEPYFLILISFSSINSISESHCTKLSYPSSQMIHYFKVIAHNLPASKLSRFLFALINGMQWSPLCRTRKGTGSYESY